MDTMGQSGTGTGMATGSRVSQAVASAVLRVDDYDRAKAFYQDTLGFKVMDEPGQKGNGAVMAGNGTMFEIYERPGMPAPQNTVLDLFVTDFDATMQELRDKGVKFEDYDIPEMGLKTTNGVAMMGDLRGAWFKDTEGNILALAEASQNMMQMMGMTGEMSGGGM